MSIMKTAAIMGALVGAFSAGTGSPQAGTKRALLREKESRKARAALYATTPTHEPSRQAMRHAERAAAKIEASRQKKIARGERQRLRSVRRAAKPAVDPIKSPKPRRRG